MLSWLQLLAAVFLLTLSRVGAAAPLAPGDVDPSFGVDGWTRLAFDRPGESPFDSARFLAVRSEFVNVGGILLSFRYLYVAGLAGDRIAIVKLDANGAPVMSFGNNGRVISTQGDIADLAGLGFAPNGDVVIGYGVRNLDNVFFHGASEDFFVEVFTRDGAPRTQGQALIGPPGGGVLTPVNWEGVNLYAPGAPGSVFCDPAIYRTELNARSLAIAPNGELTIVGQQTFSSIGAPTTRAPMVVMARMAWDAGASVYRRVPESNYALGCGNSGGIQLPAINSAGVPAAEFLPAAATYLTSADLRLAGSLRDRPSPTSAYGPSYGSYQALFNGSFANAGTAWVTPTGYWSPDSRQTRFASMRWEPSLPNLFLYGSAEQAFFAGGNQHQPIIAFDNGTQFLSPRWLFLNGILSTRSVNVQKGLRWDGKHVLLGALRLCTESNQCTGEQDSFFVAMSGGPPDNLAFPPNLAFGFEGSQQYRVPSGGANGGPAPRAWAFDGAVLESDNQGAQHLIVVGDFRGAGIADPADYDWFVTRIRLRGAPGNLTVLRSGGTGSVSSSPAGIACSPTCVAPFAGDTEVTLTATAAPGFRFDRWAGACTGTTCRLRIDGDTEVAAVFAPAGDALFANGFE
ncbi:hypothetical protein [Aquimonas sp.]|jgi:hypothetical protein|uniref:InlB B-repeat-containing protein n=1 Tax=Aquimonas sp. TaxID=1872588 RepID=UPI0037C0C37B